MITREWKLQGNIQNNENTKEIRDGSWWMIWEWWIGSQEYVHECWYESECWDEERLFYVCICGWLSRMVFFQPPPFYIAPSRLHLAVSTFTFSPTASFSFRHVSHATWILNRRSNFHVIWRVASLLILSLMNWAKLIFWAFVYPLLNQSTKLICLVWKVGQWEFGAYIYSPTLRD